MSEPKWVVVDAVPHENFTIDLLLSDGTRGVFDARHLVKEAYYSSLENPSIFMTGSAQCGTVVWADDSDISPEFLYESIRRSGSQPQQLPI